MVPLISALADARRAAGLHQQHIATGLGLGSKAGISMVSAWERGHSIPTVGHTCDYAELLGYRVVVTRGGRIVGDLHEVLPRLAELIGEAGLAVQDVADGLFVRPTSIRSIIRKAGPRTQLVSVISVLGAVRCTLDLAPAVEAAALPAEVSV